MFLNIWGKFLTEQEKTRFVSKVSFYSFLRKWSIGSISPGWQNISWWPFSKHQGANITFIWTNPTLFYFWNLIFCFANFLDKILIPGTTFCWYWIRFSSWLLFFWQYLLIDLAKLVAGLNCNWIWCWMKTCNRENKGITLYIYVITQTYVLYNTTVFSCYIVINDKFSCRFCQNHSHNIFKEMSFLDT